MMTRLNTLSRTRNVPDPTRYFGWPRCRTPQTPTKAATAIDRTTHIPARPPCALARSFGTGAPGRSLSRSRPSVRPSVPPAWPTPSYDCRAAGRSAHGGVPAAGRPRGQPLHCLVCCGWRRRAPTCPLRYPPTRAPNSHFRVARPASNPSESRRPPVYKQAAATFPGPASRSFSSSRCRARPHRADPRYATHTARP
jgi:hypothetical protein